MARGGWVFYPRRDFWEIREGTERIRLRFDKQIQLTPTFKTAFKAVLLWYAENLSISHVRNMFYLSSALFQFKHRVSKGLVSEITDLDLLNYKGAVGAEREWYLGELSGFLRQWVLLGQGGVTKEAVALLSQLRLKGNPKGVAIATMDPGTGPLTALELEAIQAALNDAYGRRAVSLDDYVLCWLLMALGHAQPAAGCAGQHLDGDGCHTEHRDQLQLRRLRRNHADGNERQQPAVHGAGERRNRAVLLSGAIL